MFVRHISFNAYTPTLFLPVHDHTIVDMTHIYTHYRTVSSAGRKPLYSTCVIRIDEVTTIIVIK